MAKVTPKPPRAQKSVDSVSTRYHIDNANFDKNFENRNRFSSLKWIIFLLLLVRPSIGNAQTSGLVAAYSFNEASGPAVTDSSGKGNNGTITTATRTAGGKFGGALSFNGTSALVTVADSTSLRLTTGMTLEAWVNPITVGGGWRDVLMKGKDNYYLEATSTNGSKPAGGGTFATTPLYGTTALAVNTWTHLAVTYDRVSLRLYVNGVQVASSAQTLNMETSTSPLQIGGDNVWGQYFAGLIDEVRIYNIALTATQIQSDMTTPVGNLTDTQPPAVSVTAPANGTFVSSSTATVSASASDNLGVVGVRFTLDGATLGAEDTTSPYAVTWNTAGATNGTHSLAAVARDAAGNTSTSAPFTVTFDNQAPTGSALVNNGAAATNSTNVTLTLSAADNLGTVSQMRFSNTGSSFGTPVLYAPTTSWTLTSGAGVKTVYAQFQDPAGNWSGSVSDTITLNTTTDTSAPSVPQNVVATALSNSSVRLSWAASVDDTAVAGYRIFRNGIQISTTTQTSAVDGGLTTATSYSYTIAAFDGAGNVSAPSTAVAVTTLSTVSLFAGPLRTNSANGRYFTDGSGKAIYLTGSHTWANFVDNGLSDPPTAFDYDDYLNMLTSNHHNLVRLWVAWEQAKHNVWTSAPYWFGQSPFQRAGPGLALDGKPKFDLTRFDQTFFDRLRQRVVQASDRGIYIAILLFNGWSIDPYLGPGNPWVGHPLNVSNNINGINGDPSGNNDGIRSHTLGNPQLTAVQEAYLRKVIDTINDLDNVLYEITNEDTGEPDDIAWQYHVISYIKSYEAGLPKQHPVGMTATFASNTDLYNSQASWLSPRGSFPLVDGSRVIMTDTDHIWGAVDGDRAWAWESFTRGMNVQFMDTYGSFDYARVAHPSLDQNSPITVNFRKNLGYILDYARRMNLNAATPQSALFSTGYGLANAAPSNAEYLGYLPNDGSITINLSATPGQLTVEWFNPSTGQRTAGSPVTGGGSRNLTSPFGGDAVVYLTNVSADSVPPTAPGGLSASSRLGGVSLSWTAASDNIAVTTYNVHRSTLTGFAPNDANRIARINALSYSDAVAPGDYFYLVTAQDAAGNLSPASNEAFGRSLPDTNPPSAPTNLSASAVSSTQINLAWTASTDDGLVSGYRIFRNGAQVGTSTTTAFSDAGLSPLTNYTYYVVAVDSSGNVSAQSQLAGATTPGVSANPPAFVQLKETRNTGSSASISAGSFNASVANGNLVVVWIWYNSASQSVSTVADTKGNTYARAVGPATGTGLLAGWRQELWYARNVIGGSAMNVTATFTASFSAEKSITAHEYSGVDTVSPLDATASAVSSSANASSGSGTVTVANELVFGAALFLGSGNAGSGFVQRSSIANNASEDRVVTSPGSYAATFINSAQAAIVQMVTFKPKSQ